MFVYPRHIFPEQIFLILIILLCFVLIPCTGAPKKSSDDLCAICLGISKQLSVELAKSANSTEVIELARYSGWRFLQEAVNLHV